MALTRNTHDATSTSGRPLPDDGDDLDAVIGRLSAADPDVRRRAALDLDAPEALPALLGRVGQETDPTVRDAVLTTLAEHDELAVAESLVTHLRSEDARLRIAVVDALASMSEGVAPLLQTLVVDPDPDVRILTAMLLGKLASSDGLPWLIEMIVEDRHPNVVATAIDALLPYANREHTGLLSATRDRFPNDPFLRFAVTSALARLDGRVPS